MRYTDIKQYIRRLISIIAIAAVWNFCAFVPGIAEDQEDAAAHEYRAKIGFVVSFLKFVDWPGDTSPRKTNKATVCILGDTEFSNAFREALSSNNSNLNITLDDSASGKNMAACNILFIGKDRESDIPSIMEYVKHRPVLTISEAKDFTDSGGIVEMIRIGKSVGLFHSDKLGFRINIRTAQDSNLNIDARVLTIATEVIK